MKEKIFALAAVLLLAFSGCIEPPVDGEVPQADDSQATGQGVESMVEGNNEFALGLYSELKEREGGENVFLSPWSISSALAMTFEGAEGETEEEMQEALNLQEEDLERRSAFAGVYNKINQENKDYELHTANALWAEQDYNFLAAYLETVERYYSGKATNLDFKGSAEEARQTINTWVEEQTKYRVKGLIPQGAIDSLTRLVLTNAVYFKGTWAKQFDKGKTMQQEFRVREGETVQVPMMSHGNEVKMNYAETEELQALEMPYEGGNLSMLVLLPRESTTLKEVEETLTLEKLEQLKGRMEKKEMRVFFPKFEFTKDYSLVSALREMGIEKAFEWPGANFSGMDGTRELYISDAIHKAFVKVDETGTEAAAATGIVVGITALPTNVFRADHPFLFFIQERETGQILFMGRVVNPTA